MSFSKRIKIGIIGLGYVGLPLALEFSKHFEVIGFDVRKERIDELIGGHDNTLEVSSQELINNPNLNYSNSPSELKDCNIYIIAVPTPVDRHNGPNLVSLLEASEMVGKLLHKNDVIIYESTVYPGATEEDCVPVWRRHPIFSLIKIFLLVIVQRELILVIK